jgi:hypothetical protein
MGKTKPHQPKPGKWLLSFFTHYEDEYSGSGDFGEEFEGNLLRKIRKAFCYDL